MVPSSADFADFRGFRTRHGSRATDHAAPGRLPAAQATGHESLATRRPAAKPYVFVRSPPLRGYRSCLSLVTYHISLVSLFLVTFFLSPPPISAIMSLLSRAVAIREQEQSAVYLVSNGATVTAPFDHLSVSFGPTAAMVAKAQRRDAPRDQLSRHVMWIVSCTAAM